MKLENERHELFCQHLAKGKSASQSYIAAGYQPCRQNASRLSSHDAIKQRVAEIQIQAAKPPDMNGRDEETGQFLKGYSRGGRPKGSRNKLAERFIADLHDEWQRSGAEALRAVAKDDPVQFVRVVAGILPKELDATLNVNVDLFQECRDFAQAFRLARDYIGADAPLMIEAEATDE
jgi:hypothetical protein